MRLSSFPDLEAGTEAWPFHSLSLPYMQSTNPLPNNKTSQRVVVYHRNDKQQGSLNSALAL